MSLQYVTMKSSKEQCPAQTFSKSDLCFHSFSVSDRSSIDWSKCPAPPTVWETPECIEGKKLDDNNNCISIAPPSNKATVNMFGKDYHLYDFCTKPMNSMRYILPDQFMDPLSIEDTEVDGTSWSVGDAKGRREQLLDGTFTPLECIRKAYELDSDAVTYNPSSKECFAEFNVRNLYSSNNWKNSNGKYRTIKKSAICNRLLPLFLVDTANDTHKQLFCQLVSQKSSFACKDASQSYDTCEKLADPNIC